MTDLIAINFIREKMKFVIASIMMTLLIGTSACAPKIQGWTQEAYRIPGFKNEDLCNQKVAVFPVLVLEAPIEKQPKSLQLYPAGQQTNTQSRVEVTEGEQKQQINKETYRIVFNEMLLRKFQEHYDSVRLMTPGIILKKINDNNLTSRYLQFVQNFQLIGLDEEKLKSFGKVLDCRYLLFSQVVVSEYKSENYYTLVWTFGGKTTLNSVKISSQIWDIESGTQTWEGSGVAYTRVSLYEGPSLIEDLAKQAVESLLETIAPSPAPSKSK
jgi:hypothetical protein